MCRMSWKSGSLNLLETSGPHRARYETPTTESPKWFLSLSFPHINLSPIRATCLTHLILLYFISTAHSAPHYARRPIAVIVTSISNKYRRVVSFQPWLLNPRDSSPQNPFCKRLYIFPTPRIDAMVDRKRTSVDNWTPCSELSFRHCINWAITTFLVYKYWAVLVAVLRRRIHLSHQNTHAPDYNFRNDNDRLSCFMSDVTELVQNLALEM